MAMEYCPNGDIFNTIKTSGKFQPELSRHYFSQLLDAVETIHNYGEVAHLDLKLENILLDAKFQLKVCDFGFAETLTRLVTTNKGTHGYKAPETYTF